MMRNIEKLVLDTLKNPNEVYYLFLLLYLISIIYYLNHKQYKGSIIFSIVDFRTIYKLITNNNFNNHSKIFYFLYKDYL